MQDENSMGCVGLMLTKRPSSRRYVEIRIPVREVARDDEQD